MESVIVNVLLSLLAACGTMVMFIIRRILARIEKLEEREHDYLNKKEIRFTIEDKVEPLRERMHRIELKLDEIINLLLKR